ncbi:MAG: hypothetical protein Roseis2KO_51050 [Roseivirga sp.]
MSLLFKPCSDLSPELIGTGYDPIKGVAKGKVGFDHKLADMVESTDNPNSSDVQRHYVYDSESVQTSISYSQKAQGGFLGLGGASESTSAKFSANFVKDTENILFQWHHHHGEKKIDINTRNQDIFNPEALKLIKSCDENGDGKEFFNVYGTHFIAGYIYGAACTLSYSMTFASASLAASFHQKVKESAGAFGIGESTQEKINATCEAMSLNNQFETDAQFTGNYQMGVLQDLDDMERELENYKQYVKSDDNSKTIISYIIAPWTMLGSVQEAFGRPLETNMATNNYSQELSDEADKLNHVKECAGSFLSKRLYMGETQYKAIKSLRDEAEAMIDQINKTLTDAFSNYRSVTKNDVDDCISDDRNSSDLEYELDKEMDRFVLSWVVYTDGDHEPISYFRDIEGKEIKAVKDDKGHWTLDASKGVYIHFSDPGDDEKGIRLSKMGDYYNRIKPPKPNAPDQCIIQANYSSNDGNILNAGGSKNNLAANDLRNNDKGAVSEAVHQKHDKRYTYMAPR